MGGNASRWYLYIPSVSFSFLTIAILRVLHNRQKRFVFVALIAIFLICSSTELYKQSLIWAQQSNITEVFLRKIEEQGIEKMKSLNFANVPFGYKSAFLFTFQSLEQAILLKYGKMPKINILSYVNLTDSMHISSITKPGQITFSITPDKYSYFIFPPLSRIFSSPETVLQIHYFWLRLVSSTPTHTVSSYDLIFPKQIESPLFYFDGQNILRTK